MKSRSQKNRRMNANQLHQLCFFLDVLSDGSEHTGQGATFLTIARSGSQENNTNATSSSMNRGIADKTILARYALSGLPTLTSRLAADQSFKLSPVRAVFCPIYDTSTTAGIPSMLLSLSNYSLTGELNIIGPKGIGNYSNEVVGLILGRRKVYPTVLNCEIPSRYENPDSASGQMNDCWWKVYEDEFIFVHARMYHGAETNITAFDLNVDQLQKALYIFTIKGHDQPSHSFGVIPPFMNVLQPFNIFHPLPQDIMHNKASKSREKVFDFIFYINPTGTTSDPQPEYSMEVANELQKLTDHHFATFPNDDNIDEEILLRASYQSKILSLNIPFAFPMSKTVKFESKVFNNGSNPKVESTHQETENTFFVKVKRLASCSSASLECMRFNAATSGAIVMFTRREEIIGKIEKISFHDKLKSPMIDELERYYLDGTMVSSSDNSKQNDDENEIDLPEESDEDDLNYNVDDNEIEILDDYEENSDNGHELPPLKRQKLEDLHADGEIYVNKNKNKAILVVMGTGCASPAPLRGSSGYALMLPTSKFCEDEKCYKRDVVLTALIDLGEGALLTLFRHLPNAKPLGNNNDLKILESLRLVFISHAHLDHYSELPMLISLISKTRTYGEVCTCYDRNQNHHRHQHSSTFKTSIVDDNPRCKTCGKIIPLLVVAPPKVLHFLDISTNCKHGIITTTNNNGHEKVQFRLYFGVTNSDFDHSPFARHLREDLIQYELRGQMPKSSNEMINHPTVPYETYRPFTFFKSVPVEHCPNAYALILGLRIPSFKGNGKDDAYFNLCYSGDTRPSQNIVRACEQLFAQSVDGNGYISLLLHEATFDDDEKGKQEARSKKHSTVQEAISIARQINAKACLLTHFSQRYPKLPPGYKSWSQANEASNSSTTTKEKTELLSISSAVDGMNIPLDNLTPLMLPLISLETLKIMDVMHNNNDA